MLPSPLIVRNLGSCIYQPIWQAMRHFTAQRTLETPDELWLLEHDPVFTQGQAGRSEHILNTAMIPVVQTDRGGQVTYHGPGQLMAYTLFNIQRLGLDIRQLVTDLEQVVITLLAEWNITAQARREAPGVYVDHAKICSIGLRVRRGCCYHGLALNVAMDLTPFTFINPCGYPGLGMTQISDQVPGISLPIVKQRLIALMAQQFNYSSVSVYDELDSAFFSSI